MIDYLIKKIKETENPTVVGLDPSLEIVPPGIKTDIFHSLGVTPQAVGKIFFEFNKAIIDSVKDLIPAVKLQIAMYERYGIEGLASYIKTIEYAKEKELIVIGDIKRGDIASTAEAYASHIGGVEILGNTFDCWKEDIITVNPYFGIDGIDPFLVNCEKYKKGIFILIRTSNRSSYELQELIVGEKAIPLYYHVADLVAHWGKKLIGKTGYSSVGAVVGATHQEQGRALRKRLPHVFFLVPGYGAQGGRGEDLKGYFDKDGLGIIVNSSRGIMGAWQKNAKLLQDPDLGFEFAHESRKAVLEMRKDLQLAMEG